MVEGDQVRPLAPATDRISSDEDEIALRTKKNLKRGRCLKCCGCCIALIIILAIVIVVLAFTVFRPKDPKIRMNGVQILQIKLINGTIPDPTVNIKIAADLSVKNENFASFRYENSTTGIYYHGKLVGEALTPAGHAKARRTERMNVTVEIITQRLLAEPNLRADAASGVVTMNSYTKLGGRVKILKIIKKHMTVRMNCTMTVNLTSLTLQEQKCKRKVKF
ncbi:Late embryogenesis abundant protein [Macleaya cordata]|uniref:Late embryogenesis abundant protein n=1 Tax=Macleaya cordata TaxID=56857 RepID=A0A200R884_MACCD|nr:Late embryogenesis abundant protein [Macleaya cordata]